MKECRYSGHECNQNEIWCECFRNPATRITRKDSYDIAAMLMRLGWVRSGQRRYIADYGRQRVFVKQTR